MTDVKEMFSAAGSGRRMAVYAVMYKIQNRIIQFSVHQTNKQPFASQLELWREAE